MCYLDSGDKSECSGCSACKSVCPKNAITMVEDKEGFKYPKIDKKKCINCNLCRKTCPFENIEFFEEKHCAFGGYNKDKSIRTESTSGGAFSAIVDAFCDKNYVIFGAATEKLNVYHTYVDDKAKINIFRKSKYSQSEIGDSYKQAKKFLQNGQKVLFSGTPCQIAGINKYLGKIDCHNLLTIEVVCEGVPSPNYVRKLDNYLLDKYHGKIESLDYRYKDYHDGRIFRYGKWDFEVMKLVLDNGKVIKKDRWFNPFWSIWLNHLMTRASCYSCPYAQGKRTADITLGDLWGVHLYCPELYGNNNGSSLIISNTSKGKHYLDIAKKYMYGHDLKYEDALKYQSPLRKHIDMNDKRDEFMQDLTNKEIMYKELIKKWYNKPSIKLLWSKYIWGNRQKVFIWNLKHKGGKND